MDGAPLSPPRPPKPRRLVEPERLKEEIGLNLKLVRGWRALLDWAASAAFTIVASLIVDDMMQRGYEVTVPPPTGMHGVNMSRCPLKDRAISYPLSSFTSANKPASAGPSSRRSTSRSPG